MNRRPSACLTALILTAALIAPAWAKDEKKAAPAEKGAAAAPPAKVYRYLSQKKAKLAGAEALVLELQDVFTGKKESLYVQSNDPTAKASEPLTAVVEALADIEPGSPVQIETEKVKGRVLVTAISKADAKPGEELPNGFVFVESKEDTKAGMPSLTVTLSKFGREVKVGVPMIKDTERKEDAEWEPDPKIDYHVRRLQNGDVVEAKIKTGRTPMLTEIYPYQTPERGTFVGLKETEFNGWTAGGFVILDDKGTRVSFTLEGTEQTRNGETMYVPHPQQVAALKRIKPDTPVEVRYRIDGKTWIARDVRVLKGAEKGAKSKPSPSSKEMEKDAADDDKMKEKKETKESKPKTAKAEARS